MIPRTSNRWPKKKNTGKLRAMDRKTTFGLRIRAARKERGLSQEALAERIDRSVDTVSNIERGITMPGYETLARLSSQLSIPLEVVCGWLAETSDSYDKERLVLESRLAAIIGVLSTRDLRIAVEQLSVLARFSGRS